MYIRKYIPELFSSLISEFDMESRIAVQYNTDRLSVDIDTGMNVGLIMNEVITNLLRNQSSKNHNTGLLLVSLEKTGGEKKITVNCKPAEAAGSIEPAGLSRQLIATLSEQIRGEVEFSAGGLFTLTFS
jgi:two-component sensor histidine kinase